MKVPNAIKKNHVSVGGVGRVGFARWLFDKHKGFILFNLILIILVCLIIISKGFLFNYVFVVFCLFYFIFIIWVIFYV